ncbi:MAG: hypothetical protein OJF55_002782 [Rhodanobacteraceae bacterium]|jgi:hypothetical protein|nr:MAG: hypothetical protein OJF55_002782 [Rhodanobacteraceae bacterium]
MSRSFWQELKRRHVYRVAAAYAAVGWLLIQVATQVFPVFHLPDWIEQAVVLVILAGSTTIGPHDVREPLRRLAQERP